MVFVRTCSVSFPFFTLRGYTAYTALLFSASNAIEEGPIYPLIVSFATILRGYLFSDSWTWTVKKLK